MRETTRHREAFDIYFALGAERTIEKLRAELIHRGNKAPTARTLYDWSSRLGWQYRIDNLEREARQSADKTRIRAIQEMNERQAREGLLLQQKGSSRLAEVPVDGMTARDAIRAVTEGSRLERLALGEVTERTESIEDPDPVLGGLSDDELKGIVDHIQQSGTRADKKRNR